MKSNTHNVTRDVFVLNLRERHGLTMRAIGALLGVSRPRVSQLYHRAYHARLVARKAERDAA